MGLAAAEIGLKFNDRIATLAVQELDLRPLTRARALVLNGADGANAMLALSARDVGYEGPIIAMIEQPDGVARAAEIAGVPGVDVVFVASSDLAAVLPTQLARYFATLLPLQTFDLPFDLGAFQLDIVSVAQRERDAALQWLIEQIAAITASGTVR